MSVKVLTHPGHLKVPRDVSRFHDFFEFLFREKIIIQYLELQHLYFKNQLATDTAT